MLKQLICLFLGLNILSTVATGNWKIKSIGNVEHAYYFYEHNRLKSICVGTEEGIIALLDPKTGNIQWREIPSIKRRLTHFLTLGKCKQLLNIF